MRVVWSSAARLAQILKAFLRHGLAHIVGGRAASWPLLSRRLPMAGLPAPQRLRILFEDIGGTFIKFGQMLALQPDVLAREYCNALFDLLDRIEPFDYAEVERIVLEELGRQPSEVFDSFEREPIATASVGQVHAAWLEGKKVAVKVQRPNVKAEFGNDIRLMSATMTAIRRLRLSRFYWLLEAMEEFVGWTREELDYRHEASCSEQLRRLSADSPGQYIPKVFAELSTRRVLVVEFLEGVPLLDYLRARERGDEVLPRRLEAKGFDRRRFASNVIDNFLGDAFRHGIYHADLHPANLMILENSVVGYIDFGITGIMSRYSRQNLVAMTLALATGDMDTLHSQFLKLSAFDESSDVHGFRAGLDQLAAAWYDDDGRHRKIRVSFTQVMTDMLQLSRQTKVMPERDIIKYIRSAIAIDGLNRRFEPDFHIGEHLEAVCGRYLQWQAIRSSVSSQNLLSLSTSGAHLMADGAMRSGNVLDRLASGELTVNARIEEENARSAGLRIKAVQLAVMVCALALLMSFTKEPVAIGWSLFTAEAALIGTGLVMLLPMLWRLASPAAERK